jgi:hypothetical protein
MDLIEGERSAHQSTPTQHGMGSRTVLRPGSGTKKVVLATLCAVMAACHALPLDPDGTSEQIVRKGYFTVASIDPEARTVPQTVQLLRTIEQMTGAKASWRDGHGEPVLRHIKDGQIDLAIGHFDAEDPWRGEVAFGPPLATSKTKPRTMLNAVMRNGENRWIVAVERASRSVAKGTQE